VECKGLPARLCSILYIRCTLTGTWNTRSVNCPGLLLGPACTPLLALGRVLAFSATFLANALACGGVGSREQKRSARSAYHSVPGYSPGEKAAFGGGSTGCGVRRFQNRCLTSIGGTSHCRTLAVLREADSRDLLEDQKGRSQVQPNRLSNSNPQEHRLDSFQATSGKANQRDRLALAGSQETTPAGIFERKQHQKRTE